MVRIDAAAILVSSGRRMTGREVARRRQLPCASPHFICSDIWAEDSTQGTTVLCLLASARRCNCLLLSVFSAKRSVDFAIYQQLYPPKNDNYPARCP